MESEIGTPKKRNGKNIGGLMFHLSVAFIIIIAGSLALVLLPGALFSLVKLGLLLLLVLLVIYCVAIIVGSLRR